MTVSIVVPVYNTAEYLPACLDSILAQSFTDFELILVDDGSTDDSLRICEAYAFRDSRIRVFHQQNAGVSAARNFGVEQAQGDWLCYVDSDDVVLPAYLQDMLEAADAEDCLVMGNISDSRMKGLITSDVVLEGEAMVRYMLSHNILNLSGPVAKLYNRATLVKYGIRFPQDIHYGEDMLYFLQYLNHIGRVAFRQSELYQVTMREGSLSRGYYSFESEYACFETCLSEMTTFASRLTLSDAEKTAVVWRNRTAQFFLHSVKSIYALSNAYVWSEQMRRLHSIPVAYYRSFGKAFQPEGLSSRLVSTLVSNRWFTLLLVFGYCYEQSRLLKIGDHS
jgi:glycosyltransferase involved in cell wall biosynthesis